MVNTDEACHTSRSSKTGGPQQRDASGIVSCHAGPRQHACRPLADTDISADDGAMIQSGARISTGLLLVILHNHPASTLESITSNNIEIRNIQSIALPYCNFRHSTIQTDISRPFGLLFKSTRFRRCDRASSYWRPPRHDVMVAVPILDSFNETGGRT